MELDVQNELSDKQTLRATAVASANAIDLGGLHYVSGYPADAGNTDGDGRIQIAHRLGTKDMPFFCVVTTAFNSGITHIDVDFKVHTEDPGTRTNVGTVIATQRMYSTTQGSQIPWPAIPRFVNARYFFLVFRPNAAPSAGAISAGFTAGMPSEL